MADVTEVVAPSTVAHVDIPPELKDLPPYYSKLQQADQVIQDSAKIMAENLTLLSSLRSVRLGSDTVTDPNKGASRTDDAHRDVQSIMARMKMRVQEGDIGVMVNLANSIGAARRGLISIDDEVRALNDSIRKLPKERSADGKLTGDSADKIVGAAADSVTKIKEITKSTYNYMVDESLNIGAARSALMSSPAANQIINSPVSSPQPERATQPDPLAQFFAPPGAQNQPPPPNGQQTPQTQANGNKEKSNEDNADDKKTGSGRFGNLLKYGIPIAAAVAVPVGIKLASGGDSNDERDDPQASEEPVAVPGTVQPPAAASGAGGAAGAAGAGIGQAAGAAAQLITGLGQAIAQVMTADIMAKALKPDEEDEKDDEKKDEKTGKDGDQGKGTQPNGADPAEQQTSADELTVTVPGGPEVQAPTPVAAEALRKELENTAPPGPGESSEPPAPTKPDARAAYAGTLGESTPAHPWNAVTENEVKPGDVAMWKTEGGEERTALVVPHDGQMKTVSNGELERLDTQKPPDAGPGDFVGFFHPSGADTADTPKSESPEESAPAAGKPAGPVVAA